LTSYYRSLLYLLPLYNILKMCPPPDAPMTGNEEMVAIDTNQPSLPPPAQTGASTVATDSDAPVAGTPNGLVSNGEHSHPPPVKSHKGVYGRASDFLSNTSNWQVGHHFGVVGE